MIIFYNNATLNNKWTLLNLLFFLRLLNKHNVCLEILEQIRLLGIIYFLQNVYVIKPIMLISKQFFDLINFFRIPFSINYFILLNKIVLFFLFFSPFFSFSLLTLF